MRDKINSNKIKSESSGAIYYSLKIIHKLLKNNDIINIFIDISENYDNYTDFINNKNFIKPCTLE